MNRKSALIVLAATAALFALWEIVGHAFLMALPMTVQHWITGGAGTAIALLAVVLGVRILVFQRKELQELARVREYLLKMEAHYLRLTPSALRDPTNYFERQALTAEINDLQRRLSSPAAADRANSVIALAALAGKRIESSGDPYPFFTRAAAHLSAALYLEAESVVRAEILKALCDLTETAASAGGTLLDALTQEVAHSNRIALAAFSEALAGHSNLESWTGETDPVEARFRSLFDDSRLWEAVRSGAIRPAGFAIAIPDPAGSKAHADRMPNGPAEARLSASAASLMDSVSALAACLRAHTTPEDYPTDVAALRNWKRGSNLDLSGCFLVGGDLKEAILPGADLREVCLQSAVLSGAHLERADLSGADLRKSFLYGAQMACARLRGARLEESGLSSADMRHADLGWAKLQAAYLIGANLEGACLFRANLGEDDALLPPADFTDANWWDASFEDGLAGQMDKKLNRWLLQRFPKPRNTDRPGGVISPAAR